MSGAINMRRFAQFGCLLLLALLAAVLTAEAQCAMCAKTVAGGGTRIIEVIKVGIYIMLVPTIFLFGAIALMIYRRRRHPMPATSVPEEISATSLPDLPGAAR